MDGRKSPESTEGDAYDEYCFRGEKVFRGEKGVGMRQSDVGPGIRPFVEHCQSIGSG